jgi:hypothetical protein
MYLNTLFYPYWEFPMAMSPLFGSSLIVIHKINSVFSSRTTSTS